MGQYDDNPEGLQVVRAPGLLWDDSLLWGVMAVKALRRAGLEFELIRARDMDGGALRGRPFLFVPGGWASNKAERLGEKGISAIREFVKEGGNYLGICGGAGLATTEGIGLLKIRRKASLERVPSFSGKIELLLGHHPVWEKIKRPYLFYVWYPSQLEVKDGVVARFGRPSDSSFVSDICIRDKEGSTLTWEELEGEYGINLNPERLYMEPAVVEGTYHRGKVFLSLVHWDFPLHNKGIKVLKNIWCYLGGGENLRVSFPPKGPTGKDPHISSMLRMAEELIDFGRRNLLWYWRNPFLLMWKRGVRGLEYSTLYVLLKELSTELKQEHLTHNVKDRVSELHLMVAEFVSKAKKLLFLERRLMGQGTTSWGLTADSEVNIMREELFGNKRRHGGFFKKIAEDLEELLYMAYCSSS